MQKNPLLKLLLNNNKKLYEFRLNKLILKRPANAGFFIYWCIGSRYKKIGYNLKDINTFRNIGYAQNVEYCFLCCAIIGV